MNRLIVITIFLVVNLYQITARKDRTQDLLDYHLHRVSNKTNLIMNDKFAQEMFTLFQRHHSSRHFRRYETRANRFSHFRHTLQLIAQTNFKQNNTFTVGINKFSDWVPSELEILRGNRPPSSIISSRFTTSKFLRRQKNATSSNSQSTSVDSFDYSTRVSALNTSTSILRPVKDQGQCGSCYAFALIKVHQEQNAQYAFHYGQAMNMSEQQIIDCSKEDFGCVGGYFNTAFNYLKTNDWYIDSTSKYPYTAVIANNCSATKTGGWAAGEFVYRHLPAGNVTAMQDALVTYGPLWISIYVGSVCSTNKASSCPVKPAKAAEIMHSFQSYTGGIFQIENCATSASNNNHAMVIVGYGHDAKTNLDYWKLRNSWGDDWGEDGYIRIKRGVNMCNVESDAFFIAKPVSSNIQ